jgi:hypothetical protein
MHHLYSIAIAFFLVETYGLHYRFAKLNRKPFNCLTCLSGWATFAQLVGNNLLYVAGQMLVTMLFATVFYNLFKRYT